MADPWAAFRITGQDPVMAPAPADPWSAFRTTDVDPNNPPPPGVIIHGSDGSYLSDRPDVKTTRPQSGDEHQTAVAMEALKKRAATGMEDVRGLQPIFQGVSGAWGDEAVANIAGGIAAAKGGNFSDNRDVSQEAMRQELAQERQDHPLRSLAGEMGGGVLSALAAPGLGSAGTLLGRMAQGAGVGSLFGLAQGAGSATDDDPNGSRGRGAGIGAIIGGAVGGGAPLAINGIARLISPLRISPERQALVDILTQEGVDVTAGQRTGSKGLKWAESALGDLPFAGGAAAEMTDRQGRQFTSAALRRMGIDAELATPDAIDAGVRQLGQTFDDLSARNTLRFDPGFAADVRQTMQDYGRVLPSQQREAILNYIQDFTQFANGMPGQVYQTARSTLGRQANAMRQSDPPFSQALAGLRDALDNAMGRSISPADQAAWQEARSQYRNWMAIQKAATGAGELAAEGYISPSQLRAAVASQNRGQYARGQGDLADLARAGEAIMRPLPNSGTAPRQAINNIVAAISGALGTAGGVAGNTAGGLPGAVTGAMAGAAVPAVLGRLLMSRPVQGYLGNQAAGALSEGQRAVLDALLAAPVRQQAVPAIRDR